jgi:molybdopterin-guanine dinucleotide biosynthesis protein A
VRVEQVGRVLVLAGRRAAEGEAAVGPRGAARPKALVEVAGVPMLERVLASVRAVTAPAPIHVSAGDPALLDATEALARWKAEGWLHAHASGPSPAASVVDFVSGAGEGASLVTTADHPLLTGEMVRHFLDHAATTGADLVAAVVLASCFRERFPRVRRTFVPLRGDAVTGANLFLFRTRAAAAGARFWQRAEALRKKPWRLAALFGPVALARFAGRRLDLEEAVSRVSGAMGVRVAVVPMPYPEVAIDVDSAADFEAASRVLAQRAALAGPQALASSCSASATKRPLSGS